MSLRMVAVKTSCFAVCHIYCIQRYNGRRTTAGSCNFSFASDFRLRTIALLLLLLCGKGKAKRDVRYKYK